MPTSRLSSIWRISFAPRRPSFRYPFSFFPPSTMSSTSNSQPVASMGKIPPKTEPGREIQSVPCKFEYTGPADISGYFLREQAGDCSGRERASLRGRGLEGVKWEVPEGYEMAVVKKRNQGPIHDIEGVSSSFFLWEFDRQPGNRSAVAKALSYLPIAEALASDD